MLDVAGQPEAAALCRERIVEGAPDARDASWPGQPSLARPPVAGVDDAASARLLRDVRATLVDDREPRILTMLPAFPDEWLGRDVEAHHLLTREGRLSFAVRWHGARPALLWELARSGSHPAAVHRARPGVVEPTSRWARRCSASSNRRAASRRSWRRCGAADAGRRRPRRRDELPVSTPGDSFAGLPAARNLHDLAASLGIDAEDGRRAEADGTLGLLIVDHLVVPEPGVYTQDEIAARSGLGDEPRKFWRALGFPDPEPDDRDRSARCDLEMLQLLDAILRLELHRAATSPSSSAG